MTAGSLAAGQPPERTTVQRLPDKQVTDRAALDALLDQALVGHLGLVQEGQPFVIPVAIARDGDRVLVHGSTGSRLFRGLAAGAPTCLTVTIVDGLLLARSQFESSMHYRSAIILGRCDVVPEVDKAAALALLTERLMPGRGVDARAGSRRELAATTVLELSLAEWSLKVSAGEPDDAAEDLDLPVWAGLVPIAHTFGTPRPAANLAPGYDIPLYVGRWPDGRT